MIQKKSNPLRREDKLKGQLEESECKDLLKHSEKVARRFWKNKEDNIWDTQ